MKRNLIISLNLTLSLSLNCWGQGSGNALTFDGINDHVKMFTTTLVKTNSTHTIEAWVKSDPTEDGVVYSEGWLSSGYRGQYRLIGNGSGYLQLFFQPSNTGGVILNATSSSIVFDGTWHHVAVVGNGNQTVLYIDGVQDATNFDYTRPALMEQTLSGIGAQIDYGGGGSGHPYPNRFQFPFSGEIDDIRLWSTNRSQSEIRDGMCMKMTGTEPNLVHYFRLDENSGLFAIDQTATSNGRLLNFDFLGSTSDWITSSAPIGDASVHDYSVTTATSLNLGSSFGDDLTANVSTIGSTPSCVHVYRVDEAPNNGTPPGLLTQLSTEVYYGVKVFGGTGVQYDVVYNYDGHPMIIDENNLDIAKRDHNADPTWSQEYAALNTTANTLTLTGQTGTEFILATIGIDPLPVELTNFDVVLKNGKANITWSTASEKDNDFFEIERSKDGLNWELVGSKIPGVGNSTIPQNYESMDYHPYLGLSYYRLKQTDIHATSSYSSIKKIHFIEEELRVFPNPTNGIINIHSNEPIESIQLFDLTGRDFSNNVEFIYQSNYSLIINMSQLKKGTYQLSVNEKVLSLLKGVN